MTDSLSKERRSALMAKVRQADTSPELKVRRVLHRLGLRFRVHPSNLPGRPDLVFPKYRAVVFVHGCFWHSHDCRAGRVPTSNTDYWLPKLRANQARDLRKSGELEAAGWRVFTVWECETKAGSFEASLAALAERIRAVPART